MLCREIIAVYSQIHTKHINTLCGQNVEVLNVRPGGTYNNHWTLNRPRRAILIAATIVAGIVAAGARPRTRATVSSHKH
jgi:hypothetical protein